MKECIEDLWECFEDALWAGDATWNMIARDQDSTKELVKRAFYEKAKVILESIDEKL